jgi:hypothetical protein
VNAKGHGPGSLVRYALKEHHRFLFVLRLKLERRFPGSRMPPTVCSRHDLNRRAPVGEHTRRSAAQAPPQSGLRRRRSFPNPNPREYGVESIPSLTNAEIKHLHFGRRKNRMFVPFDPVFAFCVPPARDNLPGLIQRRTTSSICHRDRAGSVRKHCPAPTLHSQ